MKKLVLGFLFVLVFLQPLASKALEYFNIHNSNLSKSGFSVSKDKSPSSSLTLENIVLEEDDDDDFTVAENESNISEWILENHSNTYKIFEDSFSKSIRNYATQSIFTKKPIYILCQHFLI
jgi:hypothetical protein